MKRPFLQKLIIIFAAVVLVTKVATAETPVLGNRTFSIAGLVFNSKTLQPVESATIYDATDHLLGTTDKNGYFKVTVSYNKPGEIYFKLKISKSGYTKYIQNEHWGNLANNSKFVMYFGLDPKGYHARDLSAIPQNSANSDLSYDSVLQNFNAFKQRKDFNDKLDAAKAGNENVFVQVNNEYYIVNNSGWIKLNSENDLVAIDSRQPISAKELNAVIKRRNIKGMTPLQGKTAKFALYTK